MAKTQPKRKKEKPSIKIETVYHSLAHIMALAVLRLYKEVRFGIGPATENGFFYDFEVFENGKRKRLELQDLEKIEKEMKKIIEEGISFQKKKVKIEQAQKIFKKIDQPYKLEILNNLKKEKIKEVSIYQLGEFLDLCKGPHLKNTSQAKPFAFKLLKISGAYFLSDEKNPMLDRIEGVAFRNEKELFDYLKFLEEAQNRDHKVLGPKLSLFNFFEDIGPGLVVWLEKGARLKRIIENYILEEYLKNGYQLVSTPHIAKFHLWEISGHSEFYKESMYPQMHLKEINQEEKEDYQLKPMNCPFHIMVYKNQLKSYRDLPIRLTELGTVYRYERSGTLNGLTRARGFTQDDAHIWCRKDQLEEEIKNVLSLGLKILKKFGFKNYEICLSTRPEKYIGSLRIWNKATQALKKALEEFNLKYVIDKGGGAFYGPKIDIKIKDALNRSWQCTTIQVDFNLPERFDLYFINQKGQKERPIMIHRALLGSLERFIGVLIEHYEGDFPLWLAPVQIKILPIKEENNNYALKIAQQLKEKNFRVEIDNSSETLSKRILKGELEKIPYLIIVGNQEEKENKIAVRKRKEGDLGKMKLNEFLALIEKEISFE
ncbi:MAG: threonine--tRNA ligase [Candidatus Paceibacterota bacterium]